VSTARIPVTACPACGATGFRNVREVAAIPVVECPECRMQFANPQPSDAELARIYGPGYFLQPDEAFTAANIARMKQATADLYLDLIEESAGSAPAARRLLEVGCGHGDFLVAASRRGYLVTGVEYSAHACGIAREKLGGRGQVICGEVSALPGEAEYDLAVACDVIEHVRNPGEFLHSLHTRVRAGGWLFLATPSLDSWSARLLGRRWMEYKPEHLSYFSSRALHLLLDREGWVVVAQHPGSKLLSFDYVAAHFVRFPVTGISPCLALLHRITPRRFRTRLRRVVASGTIILARKPVP
jgi:SAM-dependent methyltransferase